MKPTYEQIMQAARRVYSEDLYDVVAVRSQDVPFQLGRMSHASNVWVDGEDTGEELPGLCATYADQPGARMHASDYSVYQGYYPGEHVAIVCGYRDECGRDEDEVIIYDPVVVEILS